MQSYKKFNEELQSLKKLYEVTSFANYAADQYIHSQIKAKEIKHFEKYCSNGFKFEETASELQSYFGKNKNQSYLRELIFIRLISLLEAFFTDTINEMYVITTLPFRRHNKTFTYQMGELLTYSSIDEIHNKIFSQHVRDLDKNLSDIEKYFSKVFEINLKKNIDLYSKIDEHYDRRNLFVHALSMRSGGAKSVAKTDHMYRIKYNTNNRELGIEDGYLLQCITNLEEFSAIINNDLHAKISSSEWKEKKDDRKSFLYIVLKKTNGDTEIFNPQFRFRCGNRTIRLQSILEFKEMSGESIKLTLRGLDGELGSYYHILKKSEREGQIDIISSKFDKPSSDTVEVSTS